MVLSLRTRIAHPDRIRAAMVSDPKPIWHGTVVWSDGYRTGMDETYRRILRILEMERVGQAKSSAKLRAIAGLAELVIADANARLGPDCGIDRGTVEP